MKTDSNSGRAGVAVDALVRQIYERMIRLRLRDGMLVCLPCWMIRKPQWESAKASIDALLPEGWCSKWGDKPGVIILSNDQSEGRAESGTSPKPPTP